MFGQRIGMTPKEIQDYNLAELVELRVLGTSRIMLNPELKKKLDKYHSYSNAVEMLSSRKRSSIPAVMVPRDVLDQHRRSMSTSSGAKGGFLVDNEIVDYAAANRAAAVVPNLPLRRLQGLVGNVTVPRNKTNATTGFLAANQGASAPAADSSGGMQLGQLSMVPRTNSTVLDISLQTLKQMGPAGHDFLVGEAIGSMWAGADAQMLNGAGGEQPIGVLRTIGVGNQAGASLAWSGVADMLRTVEAAGDSPAATAWVVAPDTAKILRTRERAPGSGFILDNGMIADRPALVSGAMPAGSLVVADWSRVYFGEWGTGLEIEVSDSGTSRFDVGLISIRFLSFMDFVAANPAAISKAESIT